MLERFANIKGHRDHEALYVSGNIKCKCSQRSKPVAFYVLVPRGSKEARVNCTSGLLTSTEPQVESLQSVASTPHTHNAGENGISRRTKAVPIQFARPSCFNLDNPLSLMPPMPALQAFLSSSLGAAVESVGSLFSSATPPDANKAQKASTEVCNPHKATLACEILQWTI